MSIKQHALTTSLVLAVVFVASSAYALGVSTTAEGSAGASVGVSNAVNEGLKTGIEGSAEANTNTAVVVITRADVEGDTAATATISSATVGSDADLSGFVAAQIIADENVSKVETSADNVSVTYKQIARFVGLIPFTLNATATIRADGSVEVTYPWYAFLMITNENELEAAIEESIEGFTSTSANAAGDAGVGLSSSTQAELISEVRIVMKNKIAADMSAETNLSLETATNTR